MPEMTHFPSAQLTCELHDRIDVVASEWDELADRTAAFPFLGPGWISAWWDAFGSGALEILAVRRHGRLVGVLPLEHHGRVLRSPTNSHTPVFGPLAEDAAVALELARSLFARRPSGAHVAFLDPLGLGLATLRSAAQEARYRVLERVYARSPYLRIEGKWSDYESGLSKNIRSDVARRRRRLEEAGDVAIDVADGRKGLEQLLDDGFGIEGSGWKEQRGTAIASQLHTRSFYTEIARWAAERGCLRLAFLRLDGRAIAFLFNFEEAGVHYYLKGGYDPAYGRFSPGKVLLYAMVERAFSIGLERFEFLGGQDPYKLQLANATRELVQLQAFAPSPPALLEYAARAYGRPFAKRALALFRR